MDRAADGWGEGGAWPQSVFDTLSVRLSDVPPAMLGVQQCDSHVAQNQSPGSPQPLPL